MDQCEEQGSEKGGGIYLAVGFSIALLKVVMDVFLSWIERMIKIVVEVSVDGLCIIHEEAHSS